MSVQVQQLALPPVVRMFKGTDEMTNRRLFFLSASSAPIQETRISHWDTLD
jgi:hypothetical protein